MALKGGSTQGVVDKRTKIANLKSNHEALFKAEGVADPKWLPKMAYSEDGEKVISFFPSEIRGGKDIYTEFVSRDYTPEDPDRILYKWDFNPDYGTEYKKSAPHPATGDCRYLIPVEELINVAKLHVKKQERKPDNTAQASMEFDALPDADDLPLSEMTMRDRIAIEWKKPVSRKPWLNKLIVETFEE